MMLVAPMLQQGVAVKLPTATNTVDKPEVQGQTVIAIAKDKGLYLNAKQIGEGDLATKVTELLENSKDKIVLIKADEEVEYGAVMAAMEGAKPPSANPNCVPTATPDIRTRVSNCSFHNANAAPA